MFSNFIMFMCIGAGLLALFCCFALYVKGLQCMVQGLRDRKKLRYIVLPLVVFFVVGFIAIFMV